MSQDIVADALNMIKNKKNVKKETVVISRISNLLIEILKIMKQEGAIKKYKINVILLYDDLFSINKKRLYNFCDEIKKLIGELDWECKWTCQLSVQHIDSEMLKKLKDAGCFSINFGFESYSQKVLDSMKKPITPQLIDNAVKLIFKEKMPLQGNPEILFLSSDR